MTADTRRGSLLGPSEPRQGVVVLEAASYGLPVIASDLEGLKDAIIDGENGVLIQEKNKKMYTNKIKYFLEDQGARK